ncbi:MAG: hypothetical protein N2203_07700 [Bacteroidia bacterium]|nr:hypothetical protein [Bacteroidia bacterium]
MIKYLSIFLLPLFALFNCAKKPNYSKAPQISFKSFNILSKDSAIFTINFSDGDGDIGGGPDGQGNIFFTYYFWDADSNKYDLYVNHTFLNDTIDVRTFPSPSDAYKNKPISGEISSVLIYYRPNNNIKKMKMSAFIQDNAGNKSNVVKTPDIYAP